MKKTLISAIIVSVIQLNLVSQTTIIVNADEKLEPVSRYLFGKFTEHLGRNIYLGAWAQIVENPEFVPADRWPADENGNARILHYLERAEQEHNLSGLAESSGKGFAAYWEASEGIAGRLLKEGNRDFQWLHSNVQDGYIQTGIYPPLYRTNLYEVSLSARAERPASVTIQVLSQNGTLLGELIFTLSDHWDNYQNPLTLSGEKITKGSSCILRILPESGVNIELARILMFPSDHIDGWEPEVIRLVKDSRLPLLRYPGGNFASGYNWMDGIGPLEERPVIPNPAWPIMEWNHVGNDEWINFCRLTGAEPMVCINAGNGTPEEAANWIHYCNDPPDSRWGRMRAENGSPDPYNITLWEVGNELCGPWQIGFTNGLGYAARYQRFARAMLEADPDIKLIANGLIRVLEKSQPIDRGDNTDWNQKLTEVNGDLVRSISVHSLVGGYLNRSADPVEVWKDLIAFAENYPDFLNELVADPMRKAELEPRVAITELMDWPRHPDLPNVTSISGALWYSAIVNQAIRTGGMVELITHSALLNHGGGMRKDHGIVFTDPVYWANHFYASQNGTIPLNIQNDSPTFNASGEFIIGHNDIPYIDATVLMNEDGSSCSVFLTNRDAASAQEVNIKIEDFDEDTVVSGLMIRCDKLNIRNSWDNPERIASVSFDLKSKKGTVSYTLPPLSLVRLEFKANQ